MANNFLVFLIFIFGLGFIFPIATLTVRQSYKEKACLSGDINISQLSRIKLKNKNRNKKEK